MGSRLNPKTQDEQKLGLIQLKQLGTVHKVSYTFYGRHPVLDVRLDTVGGAHLVQVTDPRQVRQFWNPQTQLP